MSKAKPRISRKDVIFDPYCCNNIDYLNSIYTGTTKHYERLGIVGGTGSKMELATSIRNEWRTNLPLTPGLYEKKIGLTTKGPLATQLSNDCKSRFIKVFQPLLDIIAASPNIELADYDRFNIAIPKDSIHYKTEVITDITHVDVKIIGNEMVEISLRTGDSKLASIGPNADSYEVALCIIDPKFDNNPELQGQVKPQAPRSYAECPYRRIFKDAKFVEQFDPIRKACEVHVYARNYLISYPDLAGPWSDLKTFIIP